MIPKMSDIIGGSLASGIADIIKLFKVDPTIALEKQTDLETIQLNMAADAANAAASFVQGQIDTNKAEAQSGDKYASRARPTIMYICGLAMFSNFIVAPFFTWATQVWGAKVVAFPSLDMSTMLPVLLGMLGLGTLHTWENTQGGK